MNYPPPASHYYDPNPIGPPTVPYRTVEPPPPHRTPWWRRWYSIAGISVLVVVVVLVGAFAR